MDIFIKWGKNDKNGFRLPVVPDSYKIDGKQQNTSVNVHGYGEINLKGNRNLYTVSWSCFFPGKRYSFIQGTDQNATPKLKKGENVVTLDELDPLKRIKQLNTLMTDNTTIHLVIGNRVNIYGTIESLSWGENDGSGDVNYDISIKEQRSPSAKKRVSSYAEGLYLYEYKNVFTPYKMNYKWKKGDNWKSVCKKKLGDATLADKNRKANKNLIDRAFAIDRQKNKKKKKYKPPQEEAVLVGHEVILSL